MPTVEHFTLYDKECVGGLSSALQEEHLYACRRLSEVIIISHFTRVDYEVALCRHADIALATLQWHAVILPGLYVADIHDISPPSKCDF